MELILKGSAADIREVVIGERSYTTNLAGTISAHAHVNRSLVPMALTDWNAPPFEFTAGVTQRTERIQGGWEDNRLTYSIGNRANITLQLAPHPLATLKVHTEHPEINAPTLALEALAGVPVILDHSYHQLPTLHGAALLHNEQAIIFIGDSGRGKSTLTDQLGQLSGYFPLCDDMSMIDPYQRELITNIPQLKVPHYFYPAARNTARYPIRAIVEIAEQDDQVSLTHGESPQYLLSLMRHTACVRLMPRAMHGMLLPLYGKHVCTIPYYSLRYPRRMDVFAEIGAILAQELG